MMKTTLTRFYQDLFELTGQSEKFDKKYHLDQLQHFLNERGEITNFDEFKTQTEAIFKNQLGNQEFMQEMMQLRSLAERVRQKYSFSKYIDLVIQEIMDNFKITSSQIKTQVNEHSEQFINGVLVQIVPPKATLAKQVYFNFKNDPDYCSINKEHQCPELEQLFKKEFIRYWAEIIFYAIKKRSDTDNLPAEEVSYLN